MNDVAARLPQQLTRWLQRKRLPVDGWVKLDRKHLYILPTWQGVVFGTLLLTMLLASLNFNLSLGLMLTFALIGVALASMWMAYRNLQDVRIAVAQPQAIFAGETGVFPYRLTHDDGQMRIGVQLRHARLVSQETDLPPHQETLISLCQPQLPRGVHTAGRLSISAEFPFRLLHVWSYADLMQEVIVYPAPEQHPPPLPTAATAGAESQQTQPDDETPDQIRNYRPGDPLRSIAWKHSAKQDDLLTRYGDIYQPASSLIRWQDTPANMETEARLSRLAAWLLMAEASGHAFALSLPHTETSTAQGPAHLAHCLALLARWQG
ncbi:DUF58 domain-containing protein [Leeia oryzae]|uniref:DUF58 domain-containing protein n=1 Tax=Leeia oryzae TaxID=356662 RepID=UPI0003679AD2|nr:DUF58 domain-containing protein [Leeia oryzae]